jgi:tetratricopeptide (TPR) repeat protein
MDRRDWVLALGWVWLVAALAALAAEPQAAVAVAGLVDAGKYAEAEALLVERLKRDPADVEAHYYSGMIPALTGKPELYDDAIAHLQRCVELQPAVSNYHLWLARLNGVKARHAGAVNALGCVRTVKAEYLKALELDPRNFSARRDLLQFYLQAPGIVGGSLAKARALASACTPYDADMACALRADIHLYKEDYDAAKEALAAIGDGASAVAVRYARELAQALARALQAKGQPEKARQVSEKAASW